MWIEISPIASFCNVSMLFLIFSLIADAIYGYRFLASVVVSYKQVSNIWTYFSLTHIYFDHTKISAVAANSLRFFK